VIAGRVMTGLIHRLIRGGKHRRNFCCMYVLMDVHTNQLLQCYMLVVLAGDSYPPGMKLPGVPAW